MNPKKLSPWVWVPLVSMAVVVASFISTSQIRGMRAAADWLNENRPAWEEFKASDPAYSLMTLGTTTAQNGNIMVFGQTYDSDARLRVRRFINGLKPPRREWNVAVNVVSKEE